MDLVLICRLVQYVPYSHEKLAVVCHADVARDIGSAVTKQKQKKQMSFFFFFFNSSCSS